MTLTTSGNTVTAQGNLSAVPVVLGVPYEAVYEPSAQLRQQNAQGGEKSLVDVRV
jgi:hypothetical protein